MVPSNTAKWILKDMWNYDVVPDPEDYNLYSKALLVCVNGDGELTEAERKWVLGYLETCGASEELLKELENYEATDDFVQLVQGYPTVDESRRGLIYDAIRACSADGEFSDGERTTIQKMAAKLDISKAIVEQLEKAYQLEHQAKLLRLSIIYPDGSTL